MKKAILPIALLSLIAAIIVVSCQKDYNNSNLGTAAPSTSQLFSALRATPQNINVPAGQDVIVYGAQGTAMHFYPNSFKDANGNTITSGTVNLQLVEMYKPGDMICNQAPTNTSDGQMLQSSGEVNLTATMSGHEVFTNGYGLGFKQNAPDSQAMYLFYGSTANSDSIPTWTMADTSLGGNARMAHGRHGSVSSNTTCSGSSCYRFFDTCLHFNYANSDRLYNRSGVNTTVTVTVPDTSFNLTNTDIYMVFPDVNNLTQNRLHQYTIATHSFPFGDDGNQVPVGLNYKIVVITNKNGNFYYGEVGGVTTSGMNANVTMAHASLTDVKTNLSAL